MTIQIEQLLNLSRIRVLDFEMNEREIRCDIESTQGYSICHKCGQKATELYEHGETVELRHLPICERQVHLFLRTKRYRCLHCDGDVTTTEHGDWYDAKSHCTKVFADFMLLELINSTLSDVARKHHVSYDFIRGLLNRRVNDEVDWKKIKRLRLLGLDEISLLKGHRNFVTIVSTQDAHGGVEVLAVLKGREKQTVAAFLKRIPKRLRNQVEQVCTDLYAGFINAVKQVLPQAKVVADRFHVAKLYRAAVDPSVPISLETLSSNSLVLRAKGVFNVSRLVTIIEARENITPKG